MVVCAVCKVKPLFTQIITSPFKSEFGSNGSIYYCNNLYGNGLMKLFSTIPCVMSYKKLLNLEGKMIKKDGTVERIKTEPQETIIFVNKKNVKVPMRLSKAQELAESKGLNLIQLTSFGKKEFYKMITDKELMQSKKEATVKNFMFTSKITDHDFQIKMRKILESFKKHNKIKLSVKSPASNESEKAEFGEKVKNYLTSRGIRCEITVAGSNNRIQNYIVNKIMDEEENREGEIKTDDFN